MQANPASLKKLASKPVNQVKTAHVDHKPHPVDHDIDAVDYESAYEKPSAAGIDSGSDSNYTDISKMDKLQRKVKRLKGKLSKAEKDLKKANKLNKKLEEKVQNMEKRSSDIKHRETQTSDEDWNRLKLLEASDPGTYKPFEGELNVADQLKAAAEEALSISNYQFDEQTGLYYDQISKLFYDPESQLHYDSNDGIYYSYNEEYNKYEFHSRVNLDHHSKYLEHLEKKQRKLKKKSKKELKKKKNQSPEKTENGSTEAQPTEPADVKGKSDTDELEEGEVNSSSSSDDEEVQEILWRPPCVRVMVQESDCLPINTLHIITITGGWIGLEDGCLIQLTSQDENSVEERNERCCVQYNEHDYSYYLYLPESSIETTILVNDGKIPQIVGEAYWYRLSHKDKLQIYNTIFILHIHPGTETCNDCEPGLSQITNSSTTVANACAEDREKSRKAELKAMKKKYGLAADKWKNDRKLPPGYQDKSAERRDKHRNKFGVEAPETETAPASVDVALSSANVGHKLLSKMGWKEGEGLGKSQPGIVEPVQVGIRLNSSAGLGAVSNSTVSMDDGGSVSSKKSKCSIRLKTQRRYDQSKPVVFNTNEQSDEEKMS